MVVVVGRSVVVVVVVVTEYEYLKLCKLIYHLLYVPDIGGLSNSRQSGVRDEINEEWRGKSCIRPRIPHQCSLTRW